MTFSLTACGSKTDSGKTVASAPTQGNNTVTESSTQEPTEEPTEDTKIEIQADSLDALEEMVNKDVDNTVEALTKSYEKLKTEINTYNKYKANTKKVKAFYDEVLLSQQKLTTKLREYALAYAKMILASGDDMYDKMAKIKKEGVFFMSDIKYKRVLLKLSGEALAGENKTGLSAEVVDKITSQIKEMTELGVQVAVVVGGGNFWRGRQGHQMERTTADYMGMLATIMNCIYVSEIFRSQGLKTNILTPFECGSMTKLFSKDRANKYFEKGMVVFFAGGTGHPYFSTDTGIVLRAIELDADAILLAKAIDGIYDSDPKLNPEAKKYDRISINEVVEKKLGVIDMTASVMCMENKMPLMVFGLEEENSIVNALSGKFNGTVVTVDEYNINGGFYGKY